MSDRGVYIVTGYTGWHLWYWLLSPKSQAKRVARALLRDIWAGRDPENERLRLRVPTGHVYQVVDRRGNVEPDSLDQTESQAAAIL